MESNTEAPQKAKNRTAIWSSTPQYISKNKEIHKNSNSKITCTTMFIAALYIIAKIRNWSNCPSTDELDKEDAKYIMKYYSIYKRTTFCHLQHGGT